MHKLTYTLVAISIVVIITLWMLKRKEKRKEKWFSRDRNYGKMNENIWNRTVERGMQGISDINSDLKQMYPYLGYGDFTGMVCKGPNNQNCTTYVNYTL